MLGMIIADIIASRFDENPVGDFNFELFTDECHFTDTTVISLAIAKDVSKGKLTPERIADSGDGKLSFNSAVIGDLARDFLDDFIIKYPCYAKRQIKLKCLIDDIPQLRPCANNSTGFQNMPDDIPFIEKSAWILATDCSIDDIDVDKINSLYNRFLSGGLKYDALDNLEIVEVYHEDDHFNIYTPDRYIFKPKIYSLNCPSTLTEFAISTFLKSASFEDAIRLAVCAGGNQFVAITAMLAEAYFGVPKHIKETAIGYLDSLLHGIYTDWEQYAGYTRNSDEFSVLTKYIARIESALPLSHRLDGFRPDREFGDEFVNFNSLSNDFIKDLRDFLNYYNSLQINNSQSINHALAEAEKINNELSDNAINTSEKTDNILDMFNNGRILCLLKTLKNIDVAKLSIFPAKIQFWDTYRRFTVINCIITIVDDIAMVDIEYHFDNRLYATLQHEKYNLSKDETKLFLDKFNSIHVEYWANNNLGSDMGHSSWLLDIEYKSPSYASMGTIYYGTNSSPPNFDLLYEMFKKIAKDRISERKQRYLKLCNNVAEYCSNNPIEGKEITLGWEDACKEINLWTYWHGRKNLYPKILLVGQDWGNPLEQSILIDHIKNLNNDIEYPFRYREVRNDKSGKEKNPTNKNLAILFESIGYYINEYDDFDKKLKNEDLFFTNLIPYYRIRGGISRKYDPNWLTQEVKNYFSELVDILKPKTILCLGRNVFEGVMESLCENDYKKHTKGSYNDIIARGAVSIDGKKIFPLAHCGSLGTNNRNRGSIINETDSILTNQLNDWSKIIIS